LIKYISLGEIRLPIKSETKQNFEILKEATRSGDLALVDCIDINTKQHVPVICAVSIDEDQDYIFIPLGQMFENDPMQHLKFPSE
jgi:hypothetical protein